MVYRVYVEKKKELAQEAKELTMEIRELLRIRSLRSLRILNRYDVENIDHDLFDQCINTVFSEPQVDIVTYDLPAEGTIFAVEYLPGQFDQRADSAAQCIQIISQRERPIVRTAKVYVLEGKLSVDDIKIIQNHVINPVEARIASLELPETLKIKTEIPTNVRILEDFLILDHEGLQKLIDELGLAMDIDDITLCQTYFKSQNRCPTITEVRMLDTYWSDHCRHTTFLTTIDSISFDEPILQKAYDDYIQVRNYLERTKPVNLMDIGTIAAKLLKKEGYLDKLDESDEINACTVHITVNVDGKSEPWLLLFKNETHNHPTEIEPFGGAATCIGGAIRDPLASRAYVYAAMRVTGAADPRKPVSETLPGKLPQRKLVTTAAAGYSSYGNQIGLATGIVDELYHPGYAAKRMEIGAVIAAVPQNNVRRESPIPGDQVILLGGRTGRDGCGGATGSSKSHNLHSLETCGAEVQKGNAPEERKLQRLFRNGEATRMIKRCNDFGAGGVSVAIGELADGIDIELDKVPKKYAGLDGTELAISESQERMAVVVGAKDVTRFLELAANENLEATVVAEITEEPRLRMFWNGNTIVDISREFLNSNGAEKHITVHVDAPCDFSPKYGNDFVKEFKRVAADLNTCSKRGLSERFDSTIGAGTVLMPFGGKNQLTPIQAMVHKISLAHGHTDDCSLMSWGYNPYLTEKSPYHGAYLAVIESVARLIATGASFDDVYLTFQEYFHRVGQDSNRWGQPVAALLGAFEAQKNLKIAAIGGKDSMSGTFETLDVPPTLVSFAVTTDKVQNIISNEFKASNHTVCLLTPEYDENGLPDTKSLLSVFTRVTELMRKGKVLAAYTPGIGGVAEAIMKMCFGNGIGIKLAENVSMQTLFSYSYGSFVLEMAPGAQIGTVIGRTSNDGYISLGRDTISLSELVKIYENTLESIYTCNIPASDIPVQTISSPCAAYPSPIIKSSKPKVLIPVFPGTNCEYDSARAVEDAGASAEIFVIRNQSADDIARSVDEFSLLLKQSQIVFLPGGFSGGDEPDGSGKFITAFFRSSAIREEVTSLLDRRDGLMLGICNGFQALIKLGLVPYGKILDTDATFPTLTFNTIGRHQSRLVRTRVSSNRSPWLSYTNVGDIYTVPVSHGEGRFLASEELVVQLAQRGQIATQYVDMNGHASKDIHFNPNGSIYAIEGITSPDGRVLGKMGHCERFGTGLYKNVPGNYDMHMFESAVQYFK